MWKWVQGDNIWATPRQLRYKKKIKFAVIFLLTNTTSTVKVANKEVIEYATHGCLIVLSFFLSYYIMRYSFYLKKLNCLFFFRRGRICITITTILIKVVTKNRRTHTQKCNKKLTQKLDNNSIDKERAQPQVHNS